MILEGLSKLYGIYQVRTILYMVNSAQWKFSFFIYKKCVQIYMRSFCWQQWGYYCWVEKEIRMYMSWCHDAMMPWFHDVMMSWCHDAMMSWCHDDMITWTSPYRVSDSSCYNFLKWTIHWFLIWRWIYQIF